MSTVLVVRHGETTWNRDRRVQGWAPTPLTERGRRQAGALADHLAETYEVDRLLSSDLRRTRETTVHLARALDCEPTFEVAWRERDFGCLQGLGYDDLWAGYPEFAVDEVGYAAAEARPESGESLLDVRERVLARWRRLREELHPEETACVIAHGGPIYLLLGAVKGWDVERALLDQEQGNCALNELRVDGEETRVVVENETGFLADRTSQNNN